jgi:hypothetical protein
MSFETDTLHMIAPLDPNEGDIYNESIDEDAWSYVIENIYKITWHREYYVNPMVDGELSWRSMKSYDIDSDDTMERWKNNIYEVSTRRCACILPPRCVKKSLDPTIRWVGSNGCVYCMDAIHSQTPLGMHP